MITIDEFIEKTVPQIKAGTTLHEFLLDFENYYLEGEGAYVKLVPEFITLSNVHHMYIRIDDVPFTLDAQMQEFIIVPSFNVNVEDLLPQAPAGSGSVIAPDGSEALSIPLPVK